SLIRGGTGVGRARRRQARGRGGRGPAGQGLPASRPPRRIGTDRQCRRAGAVPACAMWRPDPASADFEHVADLPLTARRFLASLLRGLTLLLADESKSGAKVLILDDRPL